MQGFMVKLLICSASMSALALFYMAAAPFLGKRYSAMGRYYSWLVIVAGLIIPFRPQFSNAIVKVNMTGDGAAPVIKMGNGMHTAVYAPAVNAVPSAVPNLAWWQIAAAVWIAGTVVFLAYHMIRHYRFLKMTERWSEDITDEQILRQFQNLKNQMCLSKNIGLKFCDSIGSPMMMGIKSPRILLPKTGFTKEELHFILKHELIHYKRKDLWYKCLVLAATAVHWFNPVVYLMAKAIDNECELSCDEGVVRGLDADERLYYSETVLNAVRYQSKLKTALSTNFYGGRKGMKNRIFSIMDRNKKKTGTAVLCGLLMLTLGTGAAFAAGEENGKSPEIIKEKIVTSVSFRPDPDIYAAYAPFGITVSEDGAKLLYEGRPVRLFADDKSDEEAFYLDEAGTVNLSAVRNAAGTITGIESITAKKAKEYQEAFFGEEQNAVSAVQENEMEGSNKYDRYRTLGITYSAEDEVMYFKGQKVKVFVDRYADGEFEALWTDESGTANLSVVRDKSGKITGIESMSDENAQRYLYQ